MKGVLEYLVELSKDQNENLIRSLITDKTPIQVKLSQEEKVSDIAFQQSDLRNRVMLSGKLALHDKSLATFKFTIEGDVYFFKTLIIEENKKNFLEKNVTIYKLVRRKERRYKIPEHWTQLALILASEKNKLNTRTEIIEFSQSGIKIHTMNDFLRFDKEQIIKVQFKIYKRAEITATGIIRHIRRSKAGGFTLGIEFVKNAALTQTKIQNVCDDLSFYYTHRAGLTHK